MQGEGVGRESNKQKTEKKEKKLFLLFFRVIFAFVDAQLTLGFDAAAFAGIFAPQKRSKLKEGAFVTECAHFGSPIVSSSV